jgi:hypothetical protein
VSSFPSLRILNDLLTRLLAYPKETFHRDDLCINVGNIDYLTWYPAEKLQITKWQVLKRAVKDEPYVSEMADSAKWPQNTKDLVRKTASKHLGLKPASEAEKRINSDSHVAL